MNGSKNCSKARKILAIKPDRRSPPGSFHNPIIFDGEPASRSELMSNNGYYGVGSYVIYNRGVYQITSLPQASNDGYVFCYRARPIGMI